MGQIDNSAPGRLIVYGAGGLGRELLAMAREVWPETDILGYVDDDASIEPGTIRTGAPVLGTGDFLGGLTEPAAVVIGVMNPQIKQKIVERIQGNPMIEFPNLFHPSVKVSVGAKIGRGVVATGGNSISIDTEIGDFVLLNGNITVGHDTSIGNYSSIMPTCAISGSISIGQRVLIGTMSSLRQGLRVGDDAVVGMGSVVLRNVPAGVTVLGNPAKRIA